MMSGGTMHCSHLLSPGLFREHLPCDWASTAGCEGSSTTSKLFCYIRREDPCYTCESVFVNSPGIISERQQRTLPNFRTWGKHSLPSDLKYFNSSYFLLSVKELFWTTLSAQEMGKCLYPSLSLPVLKPQVKSHYLAEVWKGCCSWGPYSQDVNVYIPCFFKSLHSVTGNPCAILRQDIICTSYKHRNRGKGSTAHHGICQDTKSMTICVCWVLIHVLTVVGCASPQAVLYSMMDFPVSGSAEGVSLDGTV